MVRIAGGYFTIRDAEGRDYLCRARGRLKQVDREILVGERVLFRPAVERSGEEEQGGGEPGAWIVEELLPRRTALSRPRVANVEQLILIMALHAPEPDWQLADRILVLAEQQKLDVICCLNKIDLVTATEKEHHAHSLQLFPYPLIWSSAKKGIGIEELGGKLKDKSSVFAGPSGAGKSSLLNCVQPGLGLETGAVSGKIGRGRHTTRHASLLALQKGGFVVDTPGFSRVSLAGLLPEELGDMFSEFTPYAGRCSFRNCSHIHEPGCAVREALSAGTINPRRYEHYRIFWHEIAEKER